MFTRATEYLLVPRSGKPDTSVISPPLNQVLTPAASAASRPLTPTAVFLFDRLNQYYFPVHVHFFHPLMHRFGSYRRGGVIPKRKRIDIGASRYVVAELENLSRKFIIPPYPPHLLVRNISNGRSQNFRINFIIPRAGQPPNQFVFSVRIVHFPHGLEPGRTRSVLRLLKLAPSSHPYGACLLDLLT